MQARRWPWLALTAAAVLWPSRFIGPLDGVPLDGGAEALLIGLVLPSLWWLNRGRPMPNVAKAAIVALVVWKAGTALVAQQQGLCAQAQTTPFSGTAMTIRVDEPHGFLRSWDVRADLWDAEPACTAILTRPVRVAADFPAWFVNITDQIVGGRNFTVRITGFVTTTAPGTLVMQTGSDLAVGAGTHRVNEVLAITSENIHFDPRFGEEPIWQGTTTTVGPPGTVDRYLASWAWLVAPGMCLLLLGGLTVSVVKRYRDQTTMWVWVVAAAAAAVMLAQPAAGAWQRTAGFIAFGAAAVPLSSRIRNLNGAFLMVGIPWLTFFAARSFDQIGRFSIYSTDDWLAYQVAGYRIFLNGYWLEGGTPAFDYQPLYRWITGTLHLVFGDSSVGEVYADATCLLIGAMLAFQIVRATSGFRPGILAAAATLATLLIGTPWYFVGRGLSEIVAAGFAFVAIFFLLRARLGSRRWIVAAAAMTVLMFLSRLNHLLWVAFLPALLISLRVPMSWRAIGRVRLPLQLLGVYAAAFASALLLFMLRTWYYTGNFSLFHGTSLRHNDTGLRPWSLLDGAVWSRVWHSLQSFAWMNEPPHPDVRSSVMVAGLVIGVAALMQVPVARRVPAALVLTAAGSAAGAFFAHAHGYPGRFSIHALPLASAMTMIAVSKGRLR